MGPQSEGRPSEELAGRENYGQQLITESTTQTTELALRPVDRLHPPQTTEGRPPPSPTTSTNGREGRDIKGKGSDVRDRSKARSHRKGSGQLRICKKCQEPLTGQFVRALGGTFHLDCFKCKDCGQIVASKFFPADEEDGSGQYPLCETDYFRRIDLLCHDCGGALRGSYITALDRKYHIDHFTCSLCPTVFGAQDSYYEHDSEVYCHYHYSTQFAQRCNGCRTAILKQFVEIFRNGQNQHWHPECYMIHKFWNVRLAASETEIANRPSLEGMKDDERRELVRLEEEKMEEKVYRIWSVLSTFEESSAGCISDMLLHVSNGAYVDGVLTAKKFIWHVEILFTAADRLDASMIASGMKGSVVTTETSQKTLKPGLSYSREAKLLCKKIVAFFSLLSSTQDTGVKKLGVTGELLSLVTGLAHYLKLLIRICLQGALRLERERQQTVGLHDFLDGLGDLDAVKNDKSLEETTGNSALAAQESDHCKECNRPIEDECVKFDDLRWHMECLGCKACAKDLSHNISDIRYNAQDQFLFCLKCDHGRNTGLQLDKVTRLQQYVYLLRVALARLLAILKNSGALPHTTENSNLEGNESQESYRADGQLVPPMLRSDTRSKSYGGAADQSPQPSSYENTLNDVRRLRSTRMDKHLSSTIKKARTSTIMDGDGQDVTLGAAEGSGAPNMSTGEERSRDLNFYGHQDALTLDDIPRIVAAEQAKDQRPNAYKHAQHNMFRNSINEPKLLGVGTHQRTLSNGHELNNLAPVDEGHDKVAGGKRYFSELSALEYFTVRNLAVINMRSLLEGYFTVDELFGLIEPQKATFWNKLGKTFKGPPKGGKKKGIFGCPLDVILDKDGAESTDGIGPGALRIPAIVDDAIAAMRKMDLSVEGVFRKNGNIKRLNETAATIDREGCDGIDLTKENVVQVAALLKKYLRELPDPLLTFKLHRLYITSQKIVDEEKRRRLLHLTACLLPKSHRDCLEILFTFLSWVASFHQVDEESGSKMDTHNLATVIAPNILFSADKNAGMDDSFLAIEAVHSLIEYNEQMCEIPEDFQTILSDSSFFNGNEMITTKEILKRYGDMTANGGIKANNADGSSSLSRNKEGSSSGRAQAPAFTRVDTDPSQQHAWQKESSARPVQDLAAPVAVSLSHSQNGPAQPAWQGHDHPQGTTIQRNRTPDNQNERRHDWRNSGWNRPQNGGGTMGVSGTAS